MFLKSVHIPNIWYTIVHCKLQSFYNVTTNDIILVITKLKSSFLSSSGKLYFGDNRYGNQIVPMGLGGPGGGRLTVNSRHVDIDGYISADGLPPDSRSSSGAGKI